MLPPEVVQGMRNAASVNALARMEITLPIACVDNALVCYVIISPVIVSAGCRRVMQRS